MNSGKTVFSQMMDFLPLHELRKCIDRYNGDYKIKSFSCVDQYLCLVFAQLTYRESLRDIEACLRSMQNKLYHMGIRGRVSRNTLAHANQTRDWRIYADFAQVLIAVARDLYQDEGFGVELENTVYALDATLIDLCLSLFPWAKKINQRPSRASIKLQTLLDLRGNIPTFIQLESPGGIDARVLDDLVVEPGSFYIMDRGYIDFTRLYRLHASFGYFVIRAKKLLRYQRIYSHLVDKSTGLKSDQTIHMTGVTTQENYPEKLRRIRYVDSQSQNDLTFFTNNFSLPALTIAQLYKCRWQIELFFKWIKQNLRIKSFYGTSKNAVLIQVWSAISTYVLVAIIRKRLKLQANLYTILQILSVTIFEKVSLLQVLTENENNDQISGSYNGLPLFEL